MSPLRWAAALGALLSAASAGAYVQSTSFRGTRISWPVPLVPYHVSSASPAFPSPSCAPGATGDPAIEAVRAGFEVWHQACGSFEAVYAGRVNETRTGLQGMGENLVVFRNGWCSENPQALAHPCIVDPDLDCGAIFNCFEDAPADRSIVALTIVIHDADNGRIYDADIEVNAWDGQGTATPFGMQRDHGWWFTCDEPDGLAECTEYGQAGCFFIDLQNTMAHEAGHFLGLAHPCEGSSCTAQPALQPLTMYPNTGPGDVDKRSLDPDDVAGVCAIYPAGGGCGCGSGDAAGGAALLLAALALRRRAR